MMTVNPDVCSVLITKSVIPGAVTQARSSQSVLFNCGLDSGSRCVRLSFRSRSATLRSLGGYGGNFNRITSQDKFVDSGDSYDISNAQTENFHNKPCAVAFFIAGLATFFVIYFGLWTVNFTKHYWLGFFNRHNWGFTSTAGGGGLRADMNQPASSGRYSAASGPRTIQIYARLGVLIAGEFASRLG
jgi:hypothetical protein